MYLFSGSKEDYFSKIQGQIKKDIDSIKDDEILRCDLDEWRHYLIEKYSIEKIEIYEEGITQTMSETQIKKANMFFSHFGEKPYYFVDGVEIVYQVPFSGNADLFTLSPSTMIMDTFVAEKMVDPHDEDAGYFELKIPFEKRVLQEQGEKMRDYVQGQFDRFFDGYRKMITYINSDVARFNNSLKDYIQNYLDKRKQKTESFALISQALEIPVKLDKYSPNTSPIALKRIAKSTPSRPTSKPVPQEYCISDTDYANINKIIFMCGTTMEKTARTYFINGEEELRDHMLAALNTHYDNATGETFRKIGKTDINIEFDNKAAFVGECKIWHGEKLFEDAIKQALSYSTWRDTKITVIVFNKENKSFPTILEKINSWVKANTKSFFLAKKNFWECKYFRDDMGIEISLNILAFDLYVNSKQIESESKRAR